MLRAYIERGGTQGFADADTVVSEDSDAVFPWRVCAWRCIADYAWVETPGYFCCAATCLLASARGRLAHAVYFWSGILDVSPIFERSTTTQRELGMVHVWSFEPGIAATGCRRTLAQPLSAGRGRLALSTISGAPGSSRLGLRSQHLGPHPGPSALKYAHTESLFSTRWSLVSGYWHGAWWPHPVAERYRLVPGALGVAPGSYLFGTDRWAEPMHSGSVLLDLPAL